MRDQIRGLAHQDLGVEAHGNKHRAQRQVMRGQLAVRRQDARRLAGFQDAGDRIGNRRLHIGMGRIAQAGALAALADQDWLTTVQTRVAAGRDRLGAIARDNGAVPLPSATNFVTMDLGRDGDFARATLRALTDQGVFVRMPGVAPLDRCLRVSVGDSAALDIFAEALPLALKAAR